MVFGLLSCVLFKQLLRCLRAVKTFLHFCASSHTCNDWRTVIRSMIMAQSCELEWWARMKSPDLCLGKSPIVYVGNERETLGVSWGNMRPFLPHCSPHKRALVPSSAASIHMCVGFFLSFFIYPATLSCCYVHFERLAL